MSNSMLVLRHGHVRGAKVRVLQAVSQPTNDLARRVLSMAVAAVGLVVAAPLMLVVAVLIKFTSRGPVLFTQMRVGYDRRRTQRSRRLRDCRRRGDVGGKPFKIYKFRTMYTDRNEADKQVWATPDDPRITPIGRTLRKLRLDELPQLWNVLRGEMNIVGPRPEQPRIFAELRERIPRYHERQRARPGITGWAQVNQRYDQSLRDVRSKVTYDVEYVWRQSLWEDIKIMMQTIPVMIFRRGAN